MILDKILLKLLPPMGRKILNESGIEDIPRNIEEMNLFLEKLKEKIINHDNEALVIGNILFNFITNIDIRDRKTTSRTFEDIFSALFNRECSDSSSRINPRVPSYISKYDSTVSIDEEWSVSSDLSGNKREKADLILDNYHISLKTLKGMAYNENGEIIDTKINKELNIGSLSYRALLKGLLPNEEFNSLSDRKGGLGSGSQMRTYVLDVIRENNKTNDFADRLNDFVTYIYDDDIYLVLKSHYLIEFYLIPKDTFHGVLITDYLQNEEKFEKIFYRWENNNLRINWVNLLDAARKYNYNYYHIDINLSNCNHSSIIDNIKDSVENAIELVISSIE